LAAQQGEGGRRHGEGRRGEGRRGDSGCGAPNSRAPLAPMGENGCGRHSGIQGEKNKVGPTTLTKISTP
jgi:hypothetical protein